MELVTRLSVGTSECHELGIDGFSIAPGEDSAIFRC